MTPAHPIPEAASLSALYQELPTAEDEVFCFSAENLPAPPARLQSDALLVALATHVYDRMAEVDAVQLHAPAGALRQLALLLLATVFHKCDVELELSHPTTELRRVLVEKPWSAVRPEGYEVTPVAFEYYPDWVRTKHPFVRFDRDPRNELPTFHLLDGHQDPVRGEKARAPGTTLLDASSDAARIRLAGLLLNLARRDPHSVDELQLEGELGVRGVGPGSVELAVWLPGSFGWRDA